MRATRGSARLAVAVGQLIGHLRYRLEPKSVAAVAANLAHVDLPAPYVMQTFHAFGLFLVEFALGLMRSPRQVAAGWEIVGHENLDRLKTRSPGWILAGAHTGNWEHLVALADLLDRDIIVPTGTQFHRHLSPLVKWLKGKRRIHSVPTDRRLRSLQAALLRGQLVALPIDGGSYRRGIEVSLRGRPVRLAAGAARLSHLSGCPILPIFSRRTDFMRQAVTIHAPLYPTGQGRPAVHALAQQLADLLGDHLASCPGQWCLFRPIDPDWEIKVMRSNL